MTDGQTSFQDRIARIEASRAEQRATGAGLQHVSTAEMEAHIEELKSRAPGAPKRKMPRPTIPRLKFLLPIGMLVMVTLGSTVGGSGPSAIAGILFPSTDTSSARAGRSALPTVGSNQNLMPDLSGSGMSKVHAYAMEKAGVTATMNEALSEFHKATSQLNR